jgi:dCTP deaminase
MLLSYNRLLQLVGQGVIRNVDRSQINAASIDVRIGGKVLMENKPPEGIVYDAVLKARTPLRQTECDLPYLLRPGEFILAATMEEFWLPDNISAQFQLKSSGARMGLEHLKAGWCDAGWHGSKLTLELKNMTRYHNIFLQEGDKVGQLIFFEHDPVPVEGSYATKGSYNNDAGVSAVKQEKSN